MAYYVKYNDIDLTDMIKVREVNTTLTPPRENSTINIWERAGEIYNGYRWENREITLVFLLMYSEDEYDNKVAKLAIQRTLIQFDKTAYDNNT